VLISHFLSSWKDIVVSQICIDIDLASSIHLFFVNFSMHICFECFLMGAPETVSCHNGYTMVRNSVF